MIKKLIKIKVYNNPINQKSFKIIFHRIQFKNKILKLLVKKIDLSINTK